MLTEIELEKQLKEHKRLDKWWMGLTAEEKAEAMTYYLASLPATIKKVVKSLKAGVEVPPDTFKGITDLVDLQSARPPDEFPMDAGRGPKML